MWKEVCRPKGATRMSPGGLGITGKAVDQDNAEGDVG